MTRNYKKKEKVREKVRRKPGLLDTLGEKKQIIEEILSIFLAGCGLFILLSLLSYKGLGREGLPDTRVWTGITGGYLSFALYQLLGHASYAAACICCLAAAALFLRKGRVLKPLRLSFSFVIVVLAASTLHVLQRGDTCLGGHLAGGAIGRWLGELLLPLFAKAGTLLILCTATLILLVLVSGMSMRTIFRCLWKTLKLAVSLAASGVKRAVSFTRVMKKNAAKAAERAGRGVEAAAGERMPAGPRDDKIVLHEEPPAARDKKRLPAAGPARADKRASFKLPPLELLKEPPGTAQKIPKDRMMSVDQRLVDTLASYGVNGEVTAIHPGPVVTTYEFRPEKGTKISSITSREDDITMSLEAHKVRIVAPIPGKNAVGFEIPNPGRATVYLRELLEDPGFERERKKIPLALGKDIIGRPYIDDLDKMPHLLIAGTTGSGKSVSLNAMLMSLLFNFRPDELRLILVDPKQVEMQMMSGMPHMLLPVVTDPKKAALALKWAVDEMERRYQLFAANGSKDLRSYNRRIPGDAGSAKEAVAVKNAEAPIPGEETGRRAPLTMPGEPLPYIVIVIDELADLMMAAVRDVEWAITRLAQKARAAGIHLIVATQRPSVNVVTGLIKANFSCRIAFRVAAKIDSRVMLDTNGAETLLGDGDMLILPPGTSELVRVQGAFVSEDEIRAVTDFVKEQQSPSYKEDILTGSLEEETPLPGGDESDEYYRQAVDLVLSERKASVSYLQRRFSIGYNRAARIMEQMEREGIVGPTIPGKPYREVLTQASPP